MGAKALTELLAQHEHRKTACKCRDTERTASAKGDFL